MMPIPGHLIFDLGSPYDLASLTGNVKEFEKVFLPLVESDSITHVKEAETLLVTLRKLC